MPSGNVCAVCKSEIHVSINKGTGLCSENCKKKYAQTEEQKTEQKREVNLAAS